MDESRRNKEIIRDLYAHYVAGNIDAVLAGFDDEICWHSTGPVEILPWASQCVGRAEVAGWFGRMMEHIEVRRYETREFIAEGDRVVVLSDITVRARPDGRPRDFDKVDLFRLRGGKVVEFREFYDTAAAVAMMGDRETGTVAAG